MARYVEFITSTPIISDGVQDLSRIKPEYRIEALMAAIRHQYWLSIGLGTIILI